MISITYIFFLGVLFAMIGVIPPGLLNMTAAKISLKEGHVRGIMFSAGASTIVFIQTYLATLFASYLSRHPEIVEILQRVAFIIFVLITVYFLFIAKEKLQQEDSEESRSKHSRYFQGMLLSALNLFPLPYQAYITTSLAAVGWISFEKFNIISYVSGATMGTFVMLYIYIFFFDKIRSKKFTSQKNMNLLIGSITGIIAVITLVNIIRDMFV